MSKIKHVPEPWKVTGEGATICANIGHSNIVIGTAHETPNFNIKIAQANAARIVACVNACAGIEDPETTMRWLKTIKHLDTGQCIGEFIHTIESLKSQNEELKVKIKEVLKENHKMMFMLTSLQLLELMGADNKLNANIDEAIRQLAEMEKKATEHGNSIFDISIKSLRQAIIIAKGDGL